MGSCSMRPGDPDWGQRSEPRRGLELAGAGDVGPFGPLADGRTRASGRPPKPAQLQESPQMGKTWASLEESSPGG